MAGFAPDVDPMIEVGGQEAPGPWIDSDGFYPTSRGFRRQPSLVEVFPALAAPCFGAFTATYLDGTKRIIAGTTDALYYGDSGAWVDASSGTYNTPDGNRWRFAQFGNDTIAVNGRYAPQVMTDTGGTFANLAGIPPAAKIVAVVNNFVFLLNLYSATVANVLTPTMWWCSGIGSDTTWTPDIATQCVNGYLDDTPGEIVGAKTLGRNLIVYKERAVYLFEYTGPPTIWENRLLSQEAGALSHEAIVDIGDAHVFMGTDDFYIIDGSGAPRPLENPIRRYVFQDSLDRNLQAGVMGRYDKTTGVVYWHYPSQEVADTTWPQVCDRWVAWHRQTGRWTTGYTNVMAVVYPDLPQTPGLTYGSFGSVFSTWGAPTVSYDSYLIAGSADVVQGVFLDDDILYSYSGQPASGAYIEMADLGNDKEFFFTRRVRPRFSIYPSIAGTSVANYRNHNLGETPELGQTVYLDPTPGWLNIRDNARFHRFKMTFAAGDCEILGFDVDLDPAGVR